MSCAMNGTLAGALIAVGARRASPDDEGARATVGRAARTGRGVCAFREYDETGAIENTVDVLACARGLLDVATAMSLPLDPL